MNFALKNVALSMHTFYFYHTRPCTVFGLKNKKKIEDSFKVNRNMGLKDILATKRLSSAKSLSRLLFIKICFKDKSK